MPQESQFPWDLLKAECLRLVCTQLAQGSEKGGAYTGPSRREGMIEFLRKVSKKGLETAMHEVEQSVEAARASASWSRQESPPAKRKSSRLEEQNEEEEEEHQTRSKSGKRAKVDNDDAEPAPRKRGRPRKSDAEASSASVPPKRGRPRKSVEDGGSTPVARKPRAKKSETVADAPSEAKKPRGRPRKSATQEGEGDKAGTGNKEEDKTPPKRGRGRPRKNVDAEPASSAPASKNTKSVFDGVYLKKRKPDQHEGSVNEDADADGVDEDINEVQDVLANGRADGESPNPSPTDSNKENIPTGVVETVQALAGAEDDQGADADADGEPDTDMQVTQSR
ncbi:hypothetical protein CPC08DRAFT_766343 [Agrocybe pediades]|nr:hypothetical protein CPC08DRAFT_766343 [Agrocybe pediades]